MSLTLRCFCVCAAYNVCRGSSGGCGVEVGVGESTKKGDSVELVDVALVDARVSSML